MKAVSFIEVLQDSGCEDLETSTPRGRNSPRNEVLENPERYATSRVASAHGIRRKKKRKAQALRFISQLPEGVVERRARGYAGERQIQEECW